ncbi:glycosyltransferase family 39 protein [Tautonia plasticadhaerens]|uniref:glycosyltransferase family 39 protein n=1 Tax=Tautonia plasticadhaerens TaxID=2527974 RepID=UPI00119E36C0|nr:glycosyltransferase family 39 protein [Tautonia plasticadhaerens]
MSHHRAIIAVALLAVAARVAAVLVLQSHTVPRSTYEHGEIAANLLDGRGFSIRFLGDDGPTSQQAPTYPVLVAAAFGVGGGETPEALLLLQLGQAILGGLTALATMALVRELAPGRPRMAVVAGLIAAVHPTLVYSATHVQVAGLAALLVTASLAMAYRSARTGRRGDAIGAGAVLGILVLTDPILGLISSGMAWAMVRGRGAAGSIRPLATIGIVAALVVSPWVARNYRVHGEFVPVKSTFGYAFWQGNCAISEGTDKVVRPSVDRILDEGGGSLADRNRAFWEARHEAGYIDDVALTAEDYRTLGALGEPARSRLLFRRALDDLRADPARYPRLCLDRFRAFVLWDETNPKTRSLVYRAGHLGLTTLAVLGWIAMGPGLRRRMAPTLLAAALIAAFHALTIVSARFHVPIEPLMAAWASGLASGTARVGLPKPGESRMIRAVRGPSAAGPVGRSGAIGR